MKSQHETLKGDTQEVCQKVKEFMTAMRALQKAVSRKQPDMQPLKQAFDQAKKQLEHKVEETLGKLSSREDAEARERQLLINARKPLIAKTPNSTNTRSLEFAQTAALK